MYEVPDTILGVSPTVNHTSVTALIFYDLWAWCPRWGLSMMGFDLHPPDSNNKKAELPLLVSAVRSLFRTW